MSVSESAALANAAGGLNEQKIERLRRQMLNPLLMRGFMLFRLPLGLFAGMRLDALDVEHCQTSVPYGWRSTNPFRSIYFAAQSMAAELSTGALAKLAVEEAPASIAMLITGLEASFGKKASARTTFTCDEGHKIFAAVRETLTTGEAATARVETVGRMPDGIEVSRFVFTWSFKKRT
ncbi:MAG: DUF4442 domain-containing protein [Acidobacteriota bacterium]